jgi:flagellar protein FlaG
MEIVRAAVSPSPAVKAAPMPAAPAAASPQREAEAASPVRRVVAVAAAVNEQAAQIRQATQTEPAFDPTEMRQRLQQAVDRLNEQMKANGRDLAFGIDEQVDRSIITVKSTTSGELVRQIPSDDVLRVARSIEDLKGVLYDDFL